MGKRRPLTELQWRVLEVVHAFTLEQGYPPTLAEIAEHLDVTTSTAQGHVDRLIRKGALDRGEGESRRTLKITHPDFLQEHQYDVLEQFGDQTVAEWLRGRGHDVQLRRRRRKRK